MNLKEMVTSPGEHHIEIRGPSGNIEAVINVPETLSESHFAVLGHPHSLHGGTMTNKVVTTLARTFNELGIANLRFNFRGVGESEGEFDHGLGESEDMLFIVGHIKALRPDLKFIFAGFSFGSFVAYRAAAQCEHQLLLTIAPPIERFDYEAFKSSPEPWIIVQGNTDEVVNSAGVINFAKCHIPALEVLTFEETGHFFHGKLIELKNRLIEVIKRRVAGL